MNINLTLPVRCNSISFWVMSQPSIFVFVWHLPLNLSAYSFHQKRTTGAVQPGKTSVSRESSECDISRTHREPPTSSAANSSHRRTYTTVAINSFLQLVEKRSHAVVPANGPSLTLYSSTEEIINPKSDRPSELASDYNSYSILRAKPYESSTS
ncbi:hypothetical protein ACRALDRAFT_209012 [Sodiomyces alcalophilus JCM 7366]|uniref:uncharacterized protein n=1 Tax=Sodiomyces alcalophilus JCM 7366 TaxID=591952 RepID=UPI0039B60616